MNLPFTPLSLPPSSLHHQDSFLEDNTSPSFHKQTLELELKNSQLSLLSSSFSSLSSSILSLLHSSPPLSSPLNFQLKEKQQANQTQKQFSEEEKKQSEEEKKPSEEEKKPSEEEKKPSEEEKKQSEEEKKPSEEEKKPSEVEINEICSNCEEQVRKSVLIIKQFSESFDNTKRQLSQLQFELDLLRNQHSLHSQKLQVANILHSSTSSPSSPFCQIDKNNSTDTSKTPSNKTPDNINTEVENKENNWEINFKSPSLSNVPTIRSKLISTPIRSLTKMAISEECQQSFSSSPSTPSSFATISSSRSKKAKQQMLLSSVLRDTKKLQNIQEENNNPHKQTEKETN